MNNTNKIEYEFYYYCGKYDVFFWFGKKIQKGCKEYKGINLNTNLSLKIREIILPIPKWGNKKLILFTLDPIMVCIN